MLSGAKLKTSTPLQYRCDSGFGSFARNISVLSEKEIELSPVRKQSSLKCNLSAVISACKNFKKWNKSVDKVSKKLFTQSDINDSDSVKHHADSGISVSTNNGSLCENPKAFSSDENCNILPSFFEGNTYQPYKYICTEDQKLDEILKKEFKSSSEEKSISLFKLLGDDVSTDVSTDDIQDSISKCDFFRELHLRNCTIILSNILLYLSGEELRIASNVSKQWQNIVFNDKNANERRKTHISNMKNAASGPNKENRFQILSPIVRNHKSAFTSVINIKIENLQNLKFSDLNGKFDSFIEEVKVMKDKGSLMKCPKCHYPSKAHSENKFCCTRKLCQHEFCKKCLGPYLNNHLCSDPESKDSFPSLIIGSKKSKKNLRRL